MRRFVVGLTAFVAFTGTFLVLPVYAAPQPPAAPVAPAIDAVELGSVTAPADEAVVTADGEVVAVGDDSDLSVGSAAAPDDTPAGDGAAVSGDEVDGVPALTVSMPTTAGFSALGVTWAHDDAVRDVTVQVRVAGADGGWGGWTTLEAEEVAVAGGAPGDLRDGTAPYWTGPSSGVEAIVQTPEGRTPRDVQVQLIDPGSSPADANPGRPAVQDEAHAADGPTIYSRAQWGADESIRTWAPKFASTIKAATIHHTAGANGYTSAEVPEIIRSIYAYHAISRGWGDIGYNVLVDTFGRAWEGRYSGSRGVASPVIGAHAGGFNTYTVGVSMIGDFTSLTPPPAMIARVADVIAWKFRMYGVNPVGAVALTSDGGGTAKFTAGTVVRLPTVFAHRDVGNTTCPGNAGYAAMGTIRAAVAARVPGYSTPVGAVDGVVGGIGSATVSGWAVDWDQTTSATVHVYADGRGVAAWTTALPRTDLRRIYPAIGARPGFRGAVALAPGTHRVCVFAINAGPGANRLLACRSVSVLAPKPVPQGALDSATAFGDQVLVRGWAVDEDRMTTSVTVHVYADGRPVRGAVADEPDARVPARYPVAGAAHGFAEAVTLAPGTHKVCVFAINIGAGTVNPVLGCRTVTTGPAASRPQGKVTAAVVSGRMVTLTGWAVDPQAPTSPTTVRVYVDGAYRAGVVADRTTSAVAAFAPFGVTAAHGFAAAVPLNAGTHSVCAFAINTGAGTGNTLLACVSRTVAASAWNPVGALESAPVSGRTVTVTGWALDFDAPTGPIAVHVYVDGIGRGSVLADEHRADIGTAHPGTGADHGFAATVTLPAGTHSVCAYAINTGQGTANPKLGCLTATVAAAAYNPSGVVDDASVSGGSVTLTGWAFDPDVPTTPIRVHVYVDGVGRASVAADQSRPDAEAAHPGIGAAHGFTATVSLAAGTHSVCAFAINVGTGTGNTLMRCQSVTV